MGITRIKRPRRIREIQTFGVEWELRGLNGLEEFGRFKPRTFEKSKGAPRRPLSFASTRRDAPALWQRRFYDFNVWGGRIA